MDSQRLVRCSKQKKRINFHGLHTEQALGGPKCDEGRFAFETHSTSLKKNLVLEGITAVQQSELADLIDDYLLSVRARAQQHPHLKRNTKSYNKRLIKKLKVIK